MSERIDLPHGGWAQLRDPATLRRRDERTAKGFVVTRDKPILMMEELEEGVVAVMVVAWELPNLPGAPLPSETPAILGELEIDDYNAIANSEPCQQARLRLFPRPATVDQAGDPESPTPPASD